MTQPDSAGAARTARQEPERLVACPGIPGARDRAVTRGLVLIVLAPFGLLLSVLALWLSGVLVNVPPNGPTTRPATAPASQPTRSPATRPSPMRSYFDLLRDQYPDGEDPRAFIEAGDLADAARLFVTQPAVVCERGDLWLADPRADDWPTVLARCGVERVHVVRELPALVAWERRGAEWTAIPLLDRGEQVEALFGDGTTGMLGVAARHLQAGVRSGEWRFSVGGTVAAAFTFAPRRLSSISLGSDHADAEGGLVTEARGVIAWSAQRVVRFASGEWKPILEGSWDHRVLHVLPFADGTVRVIGNDDADEAEIRALRLDPPPVDAALVERLVRDLSAADGRRREEAHRQLERLGAAAWEMLERLLEGQPPEARVRMESLLAERARPTIGGYRPRSGPIRLAQRWRDGSVVLRAPHGWQRTTPEGERPTGSTLLLVRPNEAPAIAPDDIAELIDAGATLDGVCGEIVARTDRGLLRRVGTRFVPVLPARLADYAELRGIDQRGCWLIASRRDAAPLLLLDPTLPDPTPRLPTWSIPVPPGGEVGKTRDGFAVLRSGGTWVLREAGWQVLRDSDDWQRIEPRETVSAAPLSVDLPDGRTRLIADEPGAVRRLRRVGATIRELNTHRHGLPPGRRPDAMWLDPSGRLILVFLPDELVIAFPGGRVPREISNLVPARSGADEDE